MKTERAAGQVRQTAAAVHEEVKEDGDDDWIKLDAFLLSPEVLEKIPSSKEAQETPVSLQESPKSLRKMMSVRIQGKVYKVNNTRSCNRAGTGCGVRIRR